ncbi:hypothetical protein CYY_003027 [Polysphondylium violaceum]|uniref:NmrA-like domain-containing protein n=1 Tax=Polysphondylium violaceum TaxID=133409 RepID=A0A8J4Q0K3_9MYCE|nr:hypothetical protein CYY_003027 [Polysphondylium violaceum]
MVGKILVIGGTGSCGRNVVKQLEKKGQSVLVAARDEKKFKEMKFGKNTTFVKFDFNSKDTWKCALDGVDRVFLMALPLDDTPEKSMEPFINELKQSKKIKKIVFLSVLNAERFPIIKIETLIKDSGIPYSFLRPPFFMENLTDGFMKDELKQGSLSAPVGDHATAWISTQDIGDCAASLLLEESGKYDNQVINITGPAPITYPQICQLLSKYTGKNVKYNDVKPADFNKACLSKGMPQGSVQYLADLFQAVVDDKTNTVHMGVQQLTGHQPKSFECFIQESFASSARPGI